MVEDVDIGLSLDPFHGPSCASEYHGGSSPSLPAYTDVNLVPEHEREVFEQAISSFRGEIEELRSRQRLLERKRRDSLNKLLDTKGSIRVFCRVRPNLPFDHGRRMPQPVSTSSEKVTINCIGCKKEFSFDKVFPQTTTQEDVFVEVEPILRSALDGKNVCIFAYGQTGTGKTFTMEGTNDHPGIVPRALKELFRLASKEIAAPVTFSISMLEVYLGNLRDLLSYTRKLSSNLGLATKSGLTIQSGSDGSVEIEKLNDIVISDFTQANRLYVKGKKCRATSWTNVNESSSRSHCLTRVTIQFGEKPKTSKLWMVDLGGSERLLKTGATGQTMDEGKAINLSLSALGDVIAALKRKRNHVPFRNSKLTQILKDSLGDGSKALMLVHVSPSQDDIGETICSLNFAERARAIESTRELTEELRKLREKKIADLDQQIKDANQECQELRNQIIKNEHLLEEKIKLFSSTYHLSESPKYARVHPEETLESSRIFDRTIQRSGSHLLPRFMTSTASSRHRQISEAEIIARVRTLRSGHKLPFEHFGSQSFTSDHYFKTSLRGFMDRSLVLDSRKAVGGDSKLLQKENYVHSASAIMKSSFITRSRRLTTSCPNMKSAPGKHCRRVSDLSKTS